MNKIFIISGPSGVGKTAVSKGVLKKLPFLKTTLTYSTRTKRLGKKEDKTIKHITQQEFRKKIDSGDFIEWAMVHENLYGTDKKSVEGALTKNHLLMNIDVQGALQIKKRLPRDTILIFLKTQSLKELENRITKRGKMAPDILKKRLENAKKELHLAQKYDYVILNQKGSLGKTIQKVSDIISNHMDK